MKLFLIYLSSKESMTARKEKKIVFIVILTY